MLAEVDLLVLFRVGKQLLLRRLTRRRGDILFAQDLLDGPVLLLDGQLILRLRISYVEEAVVVGRGAERAVVEIKSAQNKRERLEAGSERRQVEHPIETSQGNSMT